MTVETEKVMNIYDEGCMDDLLLMLEKAVKLYNEAKTDDTEMLVHGLIRFIRDYRNFKDWEIKIES